MNLKFDEKGLIPVVVQDIHTRDVLMVAWANEEAISRTLDSGFAHYYSRSRKKIWKKGESSGHVQRIVNVLMDCDEDTLLYEVEQTGGACHMGYYSCFYRTLEGVIIREKIFEPGEVYHGENRERKEP